MGQSVMGVGAFIPSYHPTLLHLIGLSRFTYSYDMVLLSRKPQPLKSYLNILKPFSLYLWVSFWICLFTMFIIGFILGIMDRFIMKGDFNLDAGIKLVLLVYSIACSQG